MIVKDLTDRIPDYSLITVEDRGGEILIDCDSCERVRAFYAVDENIREILNKGKVLRIERGDRFDDIVISIVFD